MHNVYHSLGGLLAQVLGGTIGGVCAVTFIIVLIEVLIFYRHVRKGLFIKFYLFMAIH